MQEKIDKIEILERDKTKLEEKINELHKVEKELILANEKEKQVNEEIKKSSSLEIEKLIEQCINNELMNNQNEINIKQLHLEVNNKNEKIQDLEKELQKEKESLINQEINTRKILNELQNTESQKIENLKDDCKHKEIELENVIKKLGELDQAYEMLRNDKKKNEEDFKFIQEKLRVVINESTFKDSKIKDFEQTNANLKEEKIRLENCSSKEVMGIFYKLNCQIIM